MTDPRPSAAELVDAVAGFLEAARDDLAGASSYELRVAVNVLRIVQRELAAGDDLGLLDDERASLPGAPVSEAALAAMIREHRIPADDPALRAYLVRSVRTRIAIDSPTYPAVAEALTRWGPL